MADKRVRMLLEDFRYDPLSGVFVRQNAQHKSLIGVPITTESKDGYLVIYMKGHPYLLHRCAVAWMTSSWPVGPVDHINGNRVDNRWSNLRLVSSGVNSQNQRRAHGDSALGILGVSPHGKRGFRAQIRVDGRQKHLGTFPTAEEASAAYLNAKRAMHEGCTL